MKKPTQLENEVAVFIWGIIFGIFIGTWLMAAK